MKIILNHLGYLPNDSHKTSIIVGDLFNQFSIVNLTEMGYNEIGPNTRENVIAHQGKLQKKETMMGTYHIADFSDLKTPGIYLLTLGNHYNSVPFQIRDNLYSRTLRKAFDYIHIQRCGTEVPGYHGPCHLDDARKRSNGEYIDTTGGWHDAGDLRKWMAHTMLLGISLSILKINTNPDWHGFDTTEGDILNELRWGNSYFLKMLNENGQVWNDVGGGINGDNSDNHWTDNQIGTHDDRYINTAFNPEVQWEFIYLEALLTKIFNGIDPYYSQMTLSAAERAYRYIADYQNQTAKIMAWAILACKELYHVTGNLIYHHQMLAELNSLLELQETDYRFNQTEIKGFWYTDSSRSDFFRDHRDSGIVLIALCEALESVKNDQKYYIACQKSIKSYCEDYVYPMTATNPYRIIPYGLFMKELTDEKYRIISGELRFRFFSPSKVEFYQGLTSHLLSHAVGLQMAGKILSDQKLLHLAKSQVEWVMGCNPENACLMTAEGINNPYPHSRFLGLIPGGIMNGFIGLEDDEPFLDMSYAMDWRTTEYWSPHISFYLWYLSLLS